MRDVTSISRAARSKSLPSAAARPSEVMAPRATVGPCTSYCIAAATTARRWRHDVLEPARHHADDVVAVVVERDASAENRRVAAESPPPECVAENGNPRPVDSIIVRLEVAPERREQRRAP